MPKQYVVKLTEQERAQLLALTRKGKAGARRIRVRSFSCVPTREPVISTSSRV
jgi:hypothetical protein